MEKKNKKYVKYAMIILWMIVIFAFSAQPANISEEKSKFVITVFNALGLNLNGIFGSLADFVVRKCGHFTEYFILGCLIYSAFREKYSIKKSIVLTIVSVFFYASSDEIHQYFVPGRACRFTDVMIDTSGATFAMILVYLKSVIFNKSKKVEIS